MRTRACVASLVLVAVVSAAAVLGAAPPVFMKVQLGVGNPRGEVEKPMLQGEVPGITASHVTLSRDGTIRLSTSVHDIVYLVLDGRGTVKANGTPIDVERQMIVRLPVGWKAEWSAAPGATLNLLMIRHELSTEDRADLAAHPENQAEPYVKSSPSARRTGEAIEEREDHQPHPASEGHRPAHVDRHGGNGWARQGGAARAPDLEQFFLGLDGNDIVVHADGGHTTLGAHELLHIPLGSSHGAEVAAGKTLHYVWMDFFRDREGLKWLETHKPNEPKTP